MRPSENCTKARLREVELRYKRKRRKFTRENLREGELMKLKRSYNPNVEIAKVLRTGEWRTMTAEALGERIGLTLEERVALNIRTIAAADVTPEQAKAFYRDRRRERDRNRSRLRRLKRKQQRKVITVTKTASQIEEVGAVLKHKNAEHPAHWLSVEEIAEAVAGSKAFADLKPKSLRTQVHDALDALVERGEIETSAAIGKRSLPVRIVRWKAAVRCADGGSYGNSAELR